MNKIASLCLVIISTVFFTACEEDLDKFTMFTISDQTDFLIPSTTVIDLPIAFATPEALVNSTKEFDNNNSRKDLIEKARLTKLILNLKSPESGNFDFLNEVIIYINAEGLEKVKIASITDIPETQLKQLILNTEEIELRPYLQKDSYSLSIDTKIDKTIESDYTIEVDSDIFIDAKILGI